MENIKNKIKAYAKKIGISDMGIAPVYRYTELLDILNSQKTPFTPKAEQRIDPFSMLKDAKSAIMCVFNYYTPKPNGNIALFARGIDYHKVVSDRLNKLIKYLSKNYENERFYSFCDTSPMSDRHLAYLAGLGFIGKNRMLIHPKYGSYIVIGGILTTLKIEPDPPLNNNCRQCNLCITDCPGGALKQDGGFDANLCVSYITQKKTDLTDKQKSILKSQSNIYGCDMCTKICPHNKNAIITDIPEFKDNLISILTQEQLEEKNFKQLSNRAYHWRGSNILLRNLNLTKKKE